MNEYRKIIWSAIYIYGKEKQTLKFFEEVAELEKELCKNLFGEQNHDEIVEEIADVEIMLDQIKLMYEAKQSQVERVKAMKVQRLNERLS